MEEPAGRQQDATLTATPDNSVRAAEALPSAEASRVPVSRVNGEIDISAVAELGYN